MINTKLASFRDLQCLPGSNTLVTVSSTEGKLCFYDVESLRKFHLEVGNAKPTKTVKSKSRFLCLAVNHLRPEVKETLKKRKKRQLGKKLTKDEKIILKR